MRDLPALGAALKPIALRAGAAIMDVYGSGFTVERKDDNSPLTQADLDSQRIILEELGRLTPDIPVLSEESAEVPWERRRGWRELWVVDPLDGTREFVKRNGEFTINIALIVDHEPVLGLVSAPARRLLYWGASGLGAFRDHAGETAAAIRVAPPAHPLRIVGSRSHASTETAAYLGRLGPHVLQGIGSSLKFCLLAEGKADLYPRFGPTSEWDTAAGQALLEAAGGHVTRLDGHRLRYNCRESLINGDFLAFTDPSVLPP
ncbi:MAG TPA: 3'(2'),5'-bisphosphate nucleotidase CysQ [Steroidobacteraceae bacterium]|jgi:3'(2'), 5'-bisphosphate nucleotidase|nr:3'(2'),5'-bisphosphate nucleotidase CysQ [Steroidobacteraceae bacterium]